MFQKLIKTSLLYLDASQKMCIILYDELYIQKILS